MLERHTAPAAAGTRSHPAASCKPHGMQPRPPAPTPAEPAQAQAPYRNLLVRMNLSTKRSPESFSVRFGKKTLVLLQALLPQAFWAGQREAEQNFCRHESGEAWMEPEQLEAKQLKAKGNL